MERITTYANINSLTAFFAKRPSIEDELDDMEWSRSWMDFYSFINKQADLRLDVDPTQLSMMSKTNPYIKKMLKNASSGGSSLRCEKEAFDHLDKVSEQSMPQTLFFLDKSNKECEEIENQYGLITLNPTRVRYKAGFMFNWSLYNVTKDRGAVKRFEKWSQLERFRHPHNSMIVIDNYLLKDLGEMEENLIPMLDALLPEKLDARTYQLTLVGVDLRDKPASMKKYIEWELKNKLKRSYEIEVCVVKTESNKNHDRNIITNYLWLHSGHSFTYVRRNQISKNTNLMLFPIFYQQKDFQSYYEEDPPTETKSSVWEAVNQRLREARYIFKTASQYPDAVGGELKNSILIGKKSGQIVYSS
ncbi:hypothetical protein KMW28_16890 [Flammeovirga yaeyamensis]|uniref:Uncharacterized protein n=1 Tax=Flammeovirga yaeyamensis TaxID=367791 RepID=A0AAX1N1F3_9BACT|nr:MULTISPECIES: hypothetical protein [Flammeovirga]ANQ51251.2 hypothetical protein MY04_3907 [Flammeovirga sp. MY04]MBB3698308.1 hypothetical protein [Flammeovirga yaeyamensis]NMF34339.1 hypothetical protein [Flammeovirga yaeyamensis]QWG01320.1 hypothetical protein KMW28_16890 [Flammeovirga yaeyamensis]